MDSVLVRRRINMLAAHFAPSDDISPTHVLPMNCSGSLNSVLRRSDNKMYFARQASTSVCYFMRQTSVKEVMISASCAAAKTCGAASENHSSTRAPCSAVSARTESNFSNSVIQPEAQGQGCGFIASDPPMFAMPSRWIG